MARVWGALLLLSLLVTLVGGLGYFQTFLDGWFVVTAVGFLATWMILALFTWWVLWAALNRSVGEERTLAIALIVLLGPLGALLSYLKLFRR